MGIGTEKALRVNLIFGSVIVMLAGLFFSRALLSVGMISFLISTSLHTGLLKQVARMGTTRFLAGMTLLFIIPAITWFWSDNKEEWLHWVRIKLPLFFLPLAFAGRWQLSQQRWRAIAFVFVALVAGGCAWSLLQYAQDAEAIHEGYLRAKVFATPLENDHVRFSLLVCLGIICSALLLLNAATGLTKSIFAVLSAFFIVYLHILSARTGLLSFYIFVGCGLIYLVFHNRRRKWTIPLTGLVLLTPVAAWFYLPTFQNRIRYMLYDFSYIQSETYLPGANDGSRILSIKGGWEIIKENPFGVGAGDVYYQTTQWYDRNIPGMVQSDKVYPSSELLLYGGFAGWPGLLLFISVVFVLPFFEKIPSRRFFWTVLNIVMACSLLFDIGLEVQFGVFIYAFIILWWRKWIGGDREFSSYDEPVFYQPSPGRRGLVQ